uniref:trypsin n=1 Tax=Monopterus albus TaxID=43700 RepID=A0A3Q3K385_MONAL
FPLLTTCPLLLWGTCVTVGTVVDLQKRIIGGQTCGQHERHYHVRLRAVAADGKRYMCGGSLISDQWILTAAHCLKTMFALLGVHPGPTQQVQITTQPVIFKDKDNNNNVRHHDIMLLKLPTPTQIQPVGLPDCQNRLSVGATVQIAGHASTTMGPNNKRKPGWSNTLQCANIDIVDCQRVRNYIQQDDPQFYQAFSCQHWFCGQTPGVDVCHGDSGGGVVYQDRIYGVNSFTGDPKYACSEAAGFMDICHPQYFKWIQNTITSP